MAADCALRDRKRLFSIAPVALFAACLLSPAEAAGAFSPPAALRVVTDDNYPPYLFRGDHGELEGIVKDKWSLWSRATGVPVEVQGVDWSEAQDLVRVGAAEVIEALTWRKERTRDYEFSPGYTTIEARVYFHQSISGINDVASMRGFSVGAKEGSACGAWLKERGIDTIRWFANSEGLVKAAGSGIVRLFCMDSTVAQFFLFKHNLAEEFRQSAPLYSAQSHWAVRKGRVELRDFIQQGFDRIGADQI